MDDDVVIEPHDTDMGDDDLFSALLNHGQQRREHDQQQEAQEGFHIDVDVVESSCDALFEQLVTVNVDQGPAFPEGSPSESEAATLTERMFGPVRDLQHIGSAIHKKMFHAFRRVCSGSASAGEKRKTQELKKQLVDERLMRSKRSTAAAVNLPESSLRRSFTRFACCLVYGATWLIGAFLVAWVKILRQSNRFKGVAVFSSFKYDETPLRLNQQSWKSFFWSDAPDHVRRKQNPKCKRSEDQQGETHCHAKILAVEWKYGHLSFHHIYQ